MEFLLPFTFDGLFWASMTWKRFPKHKIKCEIQYFSFVQFCKLTKPSKILPLLEFTDVLFMCFFYTVKKYRLKVINNWCRRQQEFLFPTQVSLPFLLTKQQSSLKKCKTFKLLFVFQLTGDEFIFLDSRNEFP